jgi:two-component system chemotaxis response regulator CheB
MAEPLRVLIVDDSRIFRAALVEAIQSIPEARVVESVFSGEKALQVLAERPVDLVTLDFEMPGMDGLTTLQAIVRFNRERPEQLPVGVVMISSHTTQGATITIDALKGGAFDFIPKPFGPDVAANKAKLVAELREKVSAFQTHRTNRLLRLGLSGKTPSGSHPAIPAQTKPAERASRLAPQGLAAVAVGVSTGGPKALGAVLPPLVASVSCPIFIVQHMPKGFTASLADSLARQVPVSVAEASEGEEISRQVVRVAPGGKHLVVHRKPNGTFVTTLTEDAAECGCRPAANVLFRSMAMACGAQVAALVLTGMGQDGTEGAMAVRRAGGLVLAQDEATSVVWGMPGSVVAAGLADAVAPLEDLPGVLAELAKSPRKPLP